MKKLESSYRRIVTEFGRAFPSTNLVVMSGFNAIPPIDRYGMIDIRSMNTPEREFFLLGRHIIGDRFGAQANDLRVDSNEDDIASFSKVGWFGLQADWPITTDERCTMNGGQKPCDPAVTIGKVFEKALSLNASYIELFKEDLANPELRSIIQRYSVNFTR